MNTEMYSLFLPDFHSYFSEEGDIGNPLLMNQINLPVKLIQNIHTLFSFYLVSTTAMNIWHRFKTDHKAELVKILVHSAPQNISLCGW